LSPAVRWRVIPADTGGSRGPRAGRTVRLDQYLLARLPGESRSQIQSWIRAGRVRVNGVRTKTGHPVRAGDDVEIDEPDNPPALPRPENIPIEILYQDAEIAVVNKPAGLATHGGAGTREGTLVNALLFHLGGIDTGEPLRPGIVHRLDKGTSGLLVVARNASAHRGLQAQFKSREVRKEYRALVYGRPPARAGTLDWPIGRDPVHRKKFSTRARRSRSAITRYALERAVGPFSLLRVAIETGRTHQIRVHLARLGTPVVGDALYGGSRFRTLGDAALRAAAADLGRVFLHAELLEFDHPATGERMRFQAPLPAELVRFIEVAEGRCG
jgi:23S rRNA pseudouridine1911/1915/1917 synthase